MGLVNLNELFLKKKKGKKEVYGEMIMIRKSRIDNEK